jgi:hypothetical protein
LKESKNTYPNYHFEESDFDELHERILLKSNFEINLREELRYFIDEKIKELKNEQ